MGVVYAAFDERLERVVALKVLRRDNDANSAHRMSREAQALARLVHPNIVRVYELGNCDGHTFFSMELVNGVTGRQWLAERARSWRETLAVFVAAGRGLAAAHANGLVHRDFKPDNVMIDCSGRVVVTDFGLARSTEVDDPQGTPTRDGSVRVTSALGTPGYMSPEQFAKRALDARTDVFSFCVALWEALYGTRPFVGARSSDIEEAILRGKLTTPPRRDVPAWLRARLTRGLECEPSRRWRSMHALLEALEVPPPRPGRQWIARTGLSAALLAAGAAAGFSLQHADSALVTPVDELRARVETGWLSQLSLTLGARRCSRRAPQPLKPLPASTS